MIPPPSYVPEMVVCRWQSQMLMKFYIFGPTSYVTRMVRFGKKV